MNEFSSAASIIPSAVVPNEELPPEAEGDHAASTLNQGLKSCRTVVADYRAKLAGDLVPQTIDTDEPGDVAPAMPSSPQSTI